MCPCETFSGPKFEEDGLDDLGDIDDSSDEGAWVCFDPTLHTGRWFLEFHIYYKKEHTDTFLWIVCNSLILVFFDCS